MSGGLTCTELSHHSTPLSLSEPREHILVTETESVQCPGYLLHHLTFPQINQTCSASQQLLGTQLWMHLSGSTPFSCRIQGGVKRQGYPPQGQQTLRPLASEYDNRKQCPGSTHPLNQLRQLAAGSLQSRQKRGKKKGSRRGRQI